MAVTANRELAKLRVEQVRGDIFHFPFWRQRLFFPFLRSERPQKLNQHPFELREKMCGEDRLQRFGGAIHTCYLKFVAATLLTFFSLARVAPVSRRHLHSCLQTQLHSVKRAFRGL